MSIEYVYCLHIISVSDLFLFDIDPLLGKTDPDPFHETDSDLCGQNETDPNRFGSKTLHMI